MSASASADLAALIHHVELASAGWRDKAIDLLVLDTLRFEPLPLTPLQIRIQVNKRLPAPIAQAHIERIVDRLIKSARLVNTPDGRIKLAESTRGDLDTTAKAAESLESDLAGRFDRVLRPALQVAGEAKWASFRDGFLKPAVSELGAHAYELLTGERTDVDTTAAFRRYIETVPQQQRAELSRAIAEFIDASDPAVRRWILGHLNATFVWQALALPEAVFQSVFDRIGGPVEMNVFVDTNFLFSLIGLHDNPADDVVDALAWVAEQAEGRVNLRLLMLPCTYDEAVRTVSGYETRLAGFYISGGVARAVHQGTADLDSITLKFVTTAMRSPKPLGVREYFRNFTDNMLTIARSKGVEFWDADTDGLRTNQKVIDDLNDQLEFQKRFPEKDRKRYEAIVHDMVMWHAVSAKRPARVESPIDARWWIATLDYGLIGFDRFKAKGRPRIVPLCIHPTVLLQMLQLWIPRTEEFEIAVVESIGPLIPHIYDADTERVTIRILQALSRHEDGTGIDRDTAATVLFDNALRGRVAAARDIESAIAAVDESLVALKRQAEEQALKLDRENADLKTVLGNQDATIQQLRDQLTTAEQASLEQETDFSSQLSALEESLLAEKADREAIGNALARMESRGMRMQAWITSAGVGGITALVLATASAATVTQLSRVTARPAWAIVAFEALVVLASAAGASGVVAKGHHALKESIWPSRLIKLAGFIVGAILLTVAVDFLSNALTEPSPK